MTEERTVTEERGMTEQRTVSEELSFQGSSCDACGEGFPQRELDESRWCAGCQPIMQRRMRIGRHVVATCITLPFAVWIALWPARPAASYLPLAAWALPLAAAYYLGFRIGGEVVKGYARWRRGR